MAYDSNELFSELAGRGSSLRFFPSSVQAKTFAGGTGTIAKGTPLAYNTSTNKWVVFDADGSNGTDAIKGFLWPDNHTLVNGSETISNVMLTGRVHIDDIPVVTGYTLNELKTALQTTARGNGIIVEGLENFR